LIWGNGQTAGLFSTSSTAPTLPAGYTHKALLSAAYNDGSGNLRNYQQVNRIAWYRGDLTGSQANPSGAWVQALGLLAVPIMCNRVSVTLGSNGQSLGAAPDSSGVGGWLVHSSAGTTSETFDDVVGSATHKASGLCPWSGEMWVFSETSIVNVYVQGWEF
jgi:hypothetical protein